MPLNLGLHSGRWGDNLNASILQGVRERRREIEHNIIKPTYMRFGIAKHVIPSGNKVGNTLINATLKAHE